jgi:hypothetical protein
MEFEPNVWGPHYWFFLFTIALSYPTHVNSVTKRKYYDFIQNLPLFIPNPKIGNKFSNLLDKYPVSPYLDNRESFVRWVFFIHNKINVILSKPEITFEEAIQRYQENYTPKNISIFEKYKTKENIVNLTIIILIIFIIFIF